MSANATPQELNFKITCKHMIDLVQRIARGVYNMFELTWMSTEPTVTQSLQYLEMLVDLIKATCRVCRVFQVSDTDIHELTDSKLGVRCRIPGLLLLLVSLRENICKFATWRLFPRLSKENHELVAARGDLNLTMILEKLVDFQRAGALGRALDRNRSSLLSTKKRPATGELGNTRPTRRSRVQADDPIRVTAALSLRTVPHFNVYNQMAPPEHIAIVISDYQRLATFNPYDTHFANTMILMLNMRNFEFIQWLLFHYDEALLIEKVKEIDTQSATVGTQERPTSAIDIYRLKQAMKHLTNANWHNTTVVVQSVRGLPARERGRAHLLNFVTEVFKKGAYVYLNDSATVRFLSNWKADHPTINTPLTFYPTRVGRCTFQQQVALDEESPILRAISANFETTLPNLDTGYTFVQNLDCQQADVDAVLGYTSVDGVTSTGVTSTEGIKWITTVSHISGMRVDTDQPLLVGHVLLKDRILLSTLIV